MPKLCRIDLKQSQKIFEDIKYFAKGLRKMFAIKAIYLYGSFAKGEIREEPDIDLVIVGDFKESFPYRIGKILELTDLPVEPLVYIEEEFQKMVNDENPSIKEMLKTSKDALTNSTSSPQVC
ncbi:MAG: nucleotidyltransferase domain-containing protein [Candidatus Zixiibacteriota bacterium]